MYVCLYIISPWRKTQLSFWRNLNPPNPNLLDYASWNLSSCSVEKDLNFKLLPRDKVCQIWLKMIQWCRRKKIISKKTDRQHVIRNPLKVHLDIRCRRDRYKFLYARKQNNDLNRKCIHFLGLYFESCSLYRRRNLTAGGWEGPLLQRYRPRPRHNIQGTQDGAAMQPPPLPPLRPFNLLPPLMSFNYIKILHPSQISFCIENRRICHYRIKRKSTQYI